MSMPISVGLRNMAQAELNDYIDNEFLKPFDLFGNEPLCRFEIIETDSAKYLFYNIHHIITDGLTSLNILPMEDLASAYAGKPLHKEDKSLYEEAESETAKPDTEAYKAAEKYYREKFAGVEFVSLSRNTATPIGNIIEVDHRFPIENISQWCNGHGVKPNVLVQAAFGLVLSRLCRKQKVAYASVRHGRTEQLMHTYGMFVQTVPVLVDANPKQTVMEYIRQTGSEWQSTRKMSDYSFPAFCTDNHVVPSVFFNYQGFKLNMMCMLNGEPAHITVLRGQRTNSDLTCLLYQENTVMRQVVNASDSLYDKSFVQQFLNSVITCVKGFMKNADSSIDDISLVDEDTLISLKVLGQGPQRDYDRSETLVSMFKRQAETVPDSVAVVYKDHILTYRQLNGITDRLAALLHNRYGVTKETIVGVMIDRSEWMVVYPLAIMKAGGAYMPLDYNFPTDRLSYMVEDAGVGIILSEGDRVEKALPDFKGHVLTPEDVAAIKDEEPLPDDTLPQSDNMLAILYTSGSTGRPKGCVLEHHSVVNHCRWFAEYMGMTPADKAVAYANFGFDAHMTDIYPPLSFGASVYILPSEMRFDLPAIHQYMEDNGITLAFFTTQIGAQMASLFEFTHLRHMMVGGEKFIPIKKPAFHMHNGYGPTECTLASTVYEIRHDDEDAPIGRPIINYQAYVMDESMHLVPRGMAGELCVAGEGVGRCYLNRPDITASRFVTVDGERMYRTGDLVRWNEEGNLEYFGRMDGQVKLRGLRIEIGEIESVLSRYEAIASSAVAVQTVNGVQMLCAYYTSDEDIDESELRQFLSKQLTDFMVPEIYMRMDNMPYTPNGKVDRRALPLPKIERGKIVEPETEQERAMFEIVSEQLKSKEFGVTTNLVSMGLTSIGAIKLSVILQQRLGMRLSTKAMLKAPEIRQWIKLADSGQNPNDNIPIYPKQEFYPLTPNQLGIYIDWERHPDGLQYNVPCVLKFCGVDSARLKQSVEQTVSVHPYLKVHLQMHDGEVMQERRDDDDVEIKTIELAETPTREFLQSQILPFHILGHNLYDIRIYTHGDDTWLLLNIHHVVFDGISMNVLLDNIAKAYNGEKLSAEKVTAYDYSLYNKHWQDSAAFVEAGKHFDGIMEKAESVQYPPSTEGMSRNGAQKTHVCIGRQDVSDCAQRLGVTESSLVMAAVMQTLHRITREHDIMITTISNGRSTTDLASVFGMFVQTLPVVSHFGNGSVADVVKGMHEQMLAAVDDDKYPFTSIVEKYGASAQIMVAYQGDVLEAPIHLGNSVAEPVAMRLDTVKTPVSICVWNRSGNILDFEIEYDSDIYSEAAMQTFGHAVVALLLRMAKANGDTLVNSLAVTTDEEQQQMIMLGKGPHVDMDVTKTFANLFVEQAHKAPERLAVADADSELSYREMDAYSNLLAHKFIERGIKPDDLVCVMLERTKEFPLCVLSLHKCGAAYVPLDFEYPNQRLSFMLEDSGSKLLITTHDVLEATLAEGDFNIGNAQPFFIDDIFAEPDILEKALAAEPIDLSKPEGVAYMIYTSGSTGTPKGARLAQAGLRNFIAAVIHMERLTADDRISGHRSFSFDAHIEDMFPILTLGGSFHIMPSAIRRDLGEIRQFLFSHRITGGGYSTAVACLLLNTFDDLPIRITTAGGEKLPPVYSDHIEIVNVYGPTECTDDTSYYILKPGTRHEEIPIGTTVANCWNFVIDETGNLLPQGIAGELCFAGIQVGFGYWHREEQTAKAFGDCPFVDKDDWGRKVRMYHTGDLCRWNADGQLEYISRIDTQVKLRGFRIELGEIENAICRYDGIRTAVAVIKEKAGMQHLCAYYTADKDVDNGKLREFISQSLTDYMVPDAYMQMEELPLTPNGKVNHKALPEPVIEDTAASAYAEPEGEMETDIAEAYSKILGIERISANDNFFGLGGTSVSAIKVVAALTLKGYRLSFKDVFTCKTPRVLAAYLRGKADGASAEPVHKAVVVNEDKGNAKSEFAEILEANTIDSLSKGDSQPLGDVLLTGATGFMGIHFLRELIDNETGRIYCILRNKGNIPAESRLRSLLFYYFDNTYEELFGNRIVIINGDITDADTFGELDINVDTVINCAANVKHFSAGNDIEMVNVESVRNIIRWCLQTDTRLVHISTISIAGQSVDGSPSPETRLTERMFDFGQSLDNQYVRSKYNAEKLILEAIRDKALNAKILRVATLASRNSDGEFQINFRTNGFMGRLRAFAQLGCVAYGMMDKPCEFSPIDEVCRASRLLAKTPREMTVFHPCNNHTLPLGDVLRCMDKIGVKVIPVETDEFNERMHRMMEDESRSELLQPILAYSDNSGHDVRFIEYDSRYTTQVLYRLGYYWPFTSWDYVEKLVKLIDGFGYFDKI